MPVFNKLIRDKIPEIIEKTGKKFSAKSLSTEEYITELRKKAYEELEEYINAENKEDAVEELADLLEIIHALAESHASSIDEVEQVRRVKADKRGSFREKIFLIEVEDE